MKAGTFNIQDYLEKLHEEASIDGGVKEGDKEGLIIPEENKKFYSWLKKEYDKGKVEVKVEINMGGLKFEPGYELQTDLKSIKDFKPGMYGQVKTLDNAGAKKEKGKTPDQKSEEKPEDKSEAKTEKTAPEQKEKKEKPIIKAEIKTAKEEDEKKEEKIDDEDKEKETKKKLSEQKTTLGRDSLQLLLNLPMSVKPNLENLPYIRKIQVIPQLKSIFETLSEVKYKTYKDLLENSEVPFKTFYIAKVEEDEDSLFLMDSAGYNEIKYIAELI